MNQSTLTTEQMEVIKTLWVNDSNFRKLVSEHVRKHALQAHLEAQGLLRVAERAKTLFNEEKPQKPIVAQTKQRKVGRPNHRLAVSNILKEHPGLVVAEIAEQLEGMNHKISNRVLNSLLNQWKKEYAETNGQKGLRTEGDAPFTKFYIS